MTLIRLFSALVMLSLLASCGEQKGQKSTADSEFQSTQDYVEKASFTTLEGDSVHISDYQGKVVLIDFWETWCKPCIASFPGIDKLKDEYPDNFEVLAVTPGFTDTKENAKNFAETHDYNFTYLMDSKGLHKKLGVRGIPFKVYVAADGEFIKSSMGSSGPEGDYRKIKEIIEEHKNSDTSGQQADS